MKSGGESMIGEGERSVVVISWRREVCSIPERSLPPRGIRV